MGSSLDDLREFPDDVKEEVGFALFKAQCGERAINVTPLIMFKGAGVLEVISGHDRDTYRAVYTVRFGETIYVLHAFKKKSKSGKATPKHEMDLVERRLKAAEDHFIEQTKRKLVKKNGRQQT
ncbi:type II toxin-antitoxin system RelE/ParE family toxin [Rhizobium sp. 32-5/1]|nr:type II toxin-antitoxin system RelE/ParE family toxin [Rhizobium sp. 32-5/1]WEZ85080.1 type II toxin-antitoxin system RelE/ParE family toxin [Rhizobium sp. 32-5/1]